MAKNNVGFAKIADFFKGARAELARVEWPAREDFLGATAVMFFVVGVFALFFGLVDKLIAVVIQYIFSHT